MKNKHIQISFILLLCNVSIYAQTNTFPLSGNVGIGNLGPIWPLTVNGTVALSGNQDQVLHIRPDSGFAGYIQWAESGVAEKGLLGFNSGSGDLVYRSSANNFTNGLERFRVTTNGNFGIGTSTPDSKLSVNGNIHAKEVKIDLNGWADYVFKPTYKLIPLKDLKVYIDQNQHLPEVPTEQDVIKNGVNMGEMNKLLLKKIEEITLYLIDLKENNDLLSTENKLLKEKQIEIIKRLDRNRLK